MVRGVEIFKERFGRYQGQYAFIGGTACDIILGKLGVDFRATKDLDMVLLIEAVDAAFINEFIAFVEDGGYQHINKGTGDNQFYRFERPQNSAFPHMIELFSRQPDYLYNLDGRLAPIHISDDVMSLSAILLDDEYYHLLKEGLVTVEGVSVLDLEYIILFKMKAWLDLTARKEAGENIDSKDIKKHKNDVLRLAANIDVDKVVPISGKIRIDAVDFMERAKDEEIDVKQLGIKGATYVDVMKRIRHCFELGR